MPAVKSQRHHSRRWIVCGLLITGLLATAAWFELQRVRDGGLFLVSASWDTAATEIEKQDALRSAADMQWPAVVFLVIAGSAITLTGPARFQNRLQLSRTDRFLVAVFIISVLADLSSTLWFFHDGGIDLELHPGIRLFGYAYGRTFGPVAGKLVQAIGILAVACWLGRPGRVLMVIVSAFYLAASIHNVLQMPVFSQ